MLPSEKASEDPIRVLYVDDEPDQQEILKACVEDEDNGIRVNSVLLLKDSRNMIKGYDLVILDHQMPLISGLELLKEIRKCSDIPVIFYTGCKNSGIEAEAFSAGVNAYLKKECNLEQYRKITNTIRRMVAEYRVKKRSEILSK